MRKIKAFDAVWGLAGLAAIAAAFTGGLSAQTTSDPRVAQGMAIAPVPLNLAGRDSAMVGLGSYFVNAAGGCGDCHSNPSYLPGGDPYMGQPKKVNAAGHLGGGQAFGPFLSRNLTPDATKLPGGRTVDEFLAMMKTGVDLAKLHPQISPLLQVMPWPAYQDMTDGDLRAMYEYLRAIPCVEGGPNATPNRCLSGPPPPTISVASRNITATTNPLRLDASGSAAANGGPVTYIWENFLGGPYVTFSDPNSPTPSITFTSGPGTYIVMISVVDRAGTASSMTLKINYTGS